MTLLILFGFAVVACVAVWVAIILVPAIRFVNSIQPGRELTNRETS